MKKIGLVGGICWRSTSDYYRFLNEETNHKLGGLHFAECLIYSINFNEFASCIAAYDWDGVFRLLSNAARQLKRAGAEVLMMGANPAHIVVEQVQAEIGLPLIDIREATTKAVQKNKIRRVGLLGTIYTMELEFYKQKLVEHGLEVKIPQNKADREFLEDSLRYELSKGITVDETKRKYINIANKLISQGAEGIIFGCTDIPVPVFNTTQIHARAAVGFALSKINL